MKALIVFAIAALMFLPFQVRAAEEEFTVYITYISVEGFTLGHGFYVEPTAVHVSAGTTVWEATVQLLEGMGIAFDIAPWGGLDRIHGIHPDGGSLGMFDYTGEAGWMFTVNHFMPDVGAADIYIRPGDVIRWQFSIEGWGADLGLGVDRGFWMDPPVTHIDETNAIRMIFTHALEGEILERWLDSIISAWNRSILLTQWVNPFIDINEDDALFRYIQLANFHGILIGVPGSYFAPDLLITPATAATMLWRLEGTPEVPTEGTRWYSAAVAWAGITDTDLHAPMTEQAFARLFGLGVLEGVDFAGTYFTRGRAAQIIATFFLRV